MANSVRQPPDGIIMITILYDSKQLLHQSAPDRQYLNREISQPVILDQVDPLLTMQGIGDERLDGKNFQRLGGCKGVDLNQQFCRSLPEVLARHMPRVTVYGFTILRALGYSRIVFDGRQTERDRVFNPFQQRLTRSVPQIAGNHRKVNILRKSVNQSISF